MFHSSLKYKAHFSGRLRQESYNHLGNYYGKHYKHLPDSPYDRRKDGKALEEAEFKKLLEIAGNSEQPQIILQKRLIDDQQFINIVKAILDSDRIHICRLSLSENFIGDDGIEQVTSLIRTSTKLVTIDLSYNNISEKGGAYLLKMLETNVTIVKLSLFQNSILDNTLIEIQKLINRNVEIEAERQRYYYYIASVIITRNGNFPIDIINMVLEYFNEASILLARQYTAKTLYPEVIQFIDALEKQKLKWMSEKLLDKTSKVKEQTIEHRLEIVQEQYKDPALMQLTFNQEFLGNSSQQNSTRLIFSKLNSNKSALSDKELQTTNYRRGPCPGFSSFCSIL